MAPVAQRPPRGVNTGCGAQRRQCSLEWPGKAFLERGTHTEPRVCAEGHFRQREPLSASVRQTSAQGGEWLQPSLGGVVRQ